MYTALTLTLTPTLTLTLTLTLRNPNPNPNYAQVYDPSKKWDTYTTHGVETYGEGTAAALSQHGVLRTV